jgi:hypothetical protein
MIDSIPVSALKLGIGFEEYEKVARNIARVRSIPLRARQETLRRAERELPPETINDADKLVWDMADDRAVYKIAGLKYSRGPPPGENLFTTAVLDYLLVGKYFS